MPELPEVETIRRQLESLVIGKTISSIEVFNPGSFRAAPDSLTSRTITAIGRKGKVIIVNLKRPGLAKQGQALYMHLKMSGQLKLKKDGPLEERTVLSRHKHLRVKIKFSNKSELWFIDQRKFGWITDDSSVLPKGIDAMDPKLTADKLEEVLQSSNRPVKTILLDQSKIAGIGNIYASEILWEAGISPWAKFRAKGQPARQSLALQALAGGGLRDEGRDIVKFTKLHKAVRKVLIEAINAGGSTMGDGLYQHVGGESGDYWLRRRVYDREGELCLRCKTPVKKGVIGQRSTYWCPNCQAV